MRKFSEDFGFDLENGIPSLKPRVRRKISSWLLLPMVVLSGSAMAQTYRTIDCPDSVVTLVQDINDRGDVVGACIHGGKTRAFRVFNGRKLQMFDFPGESATSVRGINNLREMVGFYVDDQNRERAFLLRNGRFIKIRPPGATAFSIANDINDLGTIVGIYGTDEGIFHGYVRDSYGYRDLDVPENTFTNPRQINVLDHIVGGSRDELDVPRGFYFKDGKFRTIRPPGATGSYARGVNVLGQVVGNWTDDPDCPNCFDQAFLWDSRGYRFLRYPGADATTPLAINTAGQIVGFYYDVATDETHGFIRDPWRADVEELDAAPQAD
jgi:uncharacterized membrane protein